MVAKIRRGSQEFEVEDGTYRSVGEQSFKEMQNVLHGHPDGISTLFVSQSEVRITIEAYGASEDRVKTRQLSGGIGDIEQEVCFGRFEHEVQINLFNGAGIELQSQGEKMLISHVKKS